MFLKVSNNCLTPYLFFHRFIHPSLAVKFSSPSFNGLWNCRALDGNIEPLTGLPTLLIWRNQRNNASDVCSYSPIFIVFLLTSPTLALSITHFSIWLLFLFQSPTVTSPTPKSEATFLILSPLSNLLVALYFVSNETTTLLRLPLVFHECYTDFTTALKAVM